MNGGVKGKRSLIRDFKSEFDVLGNNNMTKKRPSAELKKLIVLILEFDPEMKTIRDKLCT